MRRILFWLPAILTVVWGLRDSRFRDLEGIPTGAVCLPISLGVALILLGAAWGTRWWKAGLWLALALSGQAVALQMIDAGTRLHYQHYRSPGWLAAHQPWLLLFLGLQTALVLAGLRGRWGPMRRWLGRHFRWWQVGGAAVVFVLTAATVSEDVRFYLMELVFAAFVQSVALGNIVLVGWSLPEQALPSLRARLARWFGETGGADRFAVGAALWVTIAAALLSWLSYERHPHIPDEVVYLLHARYLAEGKLTLPAPPVPAAFEIDLMNQEGGKWFCPVPPGWPAVLALGVLAGAPWLVNPLLGGINMLLANVLLRELYGRRAARLALLLLAASPWHVLMAMNFMTHTLTLTCALAAAAGVVWAKKTGKALWGAASGLAAGGALLVRPLEGFTLGCLLGLWMLSGGGTLRWKAATVAAFAAGGMLLGVPTLYYNQLLTGDPLKFPIMAYTDKYYGPNSNALGFGADRGLGWAIDPNPGHSPFDAMVNANLNLFSINIELFGWSAGSLLPAALWLLAGRLSRPDRLMLALSAAIFGVHFFYYFSGGPDFGARYWYLVLIPCVVFTVGGLELMGERLEAGSPNAGVRPVLAALALCGMAVINYFPWRAVDKYHHYEQMRPDVRSLARERRFGRSLVLVQGDRHPDYASAAVYNPLDLNAGEPIYAWDRSPEVRRQVLEVYKDRPVWILDGPTRTGAGFRVKAGPLAAGDLLIDGESME